MIYVWHHVASVAGSMVLGAALYRQRWTRVHPRLAVALWHLLALTMVVSLFGLLVSLGLRAIGLGVGPAVATVVGDDVSIRELSVIEFAALLAAIVVAAGVAGLQLDSLLRRARVRSRHRALLGVVGDDSLGDVTVIDHSAALVYALPGRDPRIVATSGALHRLDEAELQAVIAHERNHLARRHDLALLPFFTLRRALPRSKGAVAIETEVELLLEMCADDHAVRHGHRVPLIRAIAIFAAYHHPVTPATTTPTYTQTAAVRARQDRLTAPPNHSRFVTITGLYAAALTLTANTLSLYALPT